MFEVLEFSTDSGWLTAVHVIFTVLVVTFVLMVIVMIMLCIMQDDPKILVVSGGTLGVIGILSMGALAGAVVGSVDDRKVIAAEGYESTGEDFHAHHENIEAIKVSGEGPSDNEGLGQSLHNDSDWTPVTFSTNDGDYYDRARIVYEEVSNDENAEPGEVLRKAWIEVSEDNPDEWIRWEENE